MANWWASSSHVAFVPMGNTRVHCTGSFNALALFHAPRWKLEQHTIVLGLKLHVLRITQPECQATHADVCRRLLTRHMLRITV